MNLAASNQIDKLIRDSDLFNFNTESYINKDNYNFDNEVILITGAAGSIGSELSKQIVNCKFKKLILVDIAESPMYNLIKDLELSASNIEYILLNIEEKASIESLFETFKPTLIFHAAAYKHVPLMEENPFKAVRLNFYATKLLADTAIAFKVKKFVFISTDKAVNPISIMGMTKRVAENYLNSLNIKDKGTYFVNTRFGNVFGSNGSVVPLIIKQIKTNSPITITDDSISRYFICKHKACRLIIKIATLKEQDSNLFTFNMGDPIKIIDLAKKLISHYSSNGYTHEIKITGLRPGEKLIEEIVSKNETLSPTDYNDILLVKPKNSTNLESYDFNTLLHITHATKLSEIKSILKKLI